jgi:hypothetical protein
MYSCFVDGEHFGATGRAVEDPIGETAHLGVTALAGMPAQGIR